MSTYEFPGDTVCRIAAVMAYSKGPKKELFASGVHGQHMGSIGSSAYCIIIRKDSKDFL